MSKAEKLRRHRAARDSMDLAPTPRRAKKGKARMRELAQAKPEDASLPAIAARCRRAGVEPTEDNMRAMRDQWKGCQAGMAIDMIADKHADKAKLWDAVQHIRAAYAAYCRAEGIPQPHATCLRILLPVDEMHADAASPPRDLRTEAERLEAARKSWAQVEAWIGRYGRHTAGITRRCVIEDQPCEHATSMALALDVVAKGLAGRK